MIGRAFSVVDPIKACTTRYFEKQQGAEDETDVLREGIGKEIETEYTNRKGH